MNAKFLCLAKILTLINSDCPVESFIGLPNFSALAIGCRREALKHMIVDGLTFSRFFGFEFYDPELYVEKAPATSEETMVLGCTYEKILDKNSECYKAFVEFNRKYSQVDPNTVYPPPLFVPLGRFFPDPKIDLFQSSQVFGRSLGTPNNIFDRSPDMNFRRKKFSGRPGVPIC